MALIDWTDEMDVGIPEIDRQHRGLIALVNDLDRAMRERRGQEETARVARELVAYVRTHFALEEELFRKYGYPETYEHTRSHVEFTRRAHEFRTQAEAGKLLLSVEITRFLKDWWAHHIKVEDQQYAPFLRERMGGER